MRAGSIERHMKNFYLTVGLLCLLIAAAAILFSFGFMNQYRQIFGQLSSFNKMCEYIAEANTDADYYSQIQQEEYFEKIEPVMEKAVSQINDLRTRTQDAFLLREYQDMEEMCTSFTQQAKELKQSVENYTANGESDYYTIAPQHQTLTQINEAITDRYNYIRNRMAQNLEKSDRQLRVQFYLLSVVFLFTVIVVIILVKIKIGRISVCITRPIQRLADRAMQIREANLYEKTSTAGALPDMTILKLEPLPIEKGTDQEVAGLTDVFNSMMERLYQQFETLKENAQIMEELEKTRFKELQMQINPHFMFNTLNMISEKAYLEGADDTVNLLQTAAGMFRYSLDYSGKAVTLAKEMEQLGNYVQIQEQRFGQRIHFYFDLDETYHEVLVPALTLQPLVENVIIHGFGMRTEAGEIRISTAFREEDRKVLIRIADNGIGMTAQKLAEVTEAMHSYKGNTVRIGLGNVYMRLQHFYDGQSELLIESQSGEGTTVTITIPYGEKHMGKVSLQS